MTRKRAMSTIEWSLVIGFVGGIVLNLIREANDGSSNFLFGLMAAVGSGSLAYLFISKCRGEPLPDVRISLRDMLKVCGALFVLVILTYSVEWWQDATAIPCRDDPRHEHIVCRLPNGHLQHWTHDE